MAIVSDILAEEKIKRDLKTAEDVARVAAAFDGLRCTLADTCVAAHSRAVAAAATAEEHGKLLQELQAALAAAGSLMNAQHEPAIQSARCVASPLHPDCLLCLSIKPMTNIALGHLLSVFSLLQDVSFFYSIACFQTH